MEALTHALRMVVFLFMQPEVQGFLLTSLVLSLIFFPLAARTIIRQWESAGENGGDCLEDKTEARVRRAVGGKTYRSVLIQGKDGYTTEIDIVDVCRKGILLFECKLRTSPVTGDVKDELWVCGKNGEYDMENPIRQNYYHKGAILKHLVLNIKPLPNVPIISIVMMQCPKNSKITGTDTLKETIFCRKFPELERKLRALPDATWSEDDLQAVNELMSALPATEEQLEAHAQRLRELVKAG